MTAQRGRDLLLKIDDGSSNFVTVAGLRAKQLSLNAESIDTTDSESAGRWRELLAGVGLRRASLTGSGIFKDKSSDEMMRTVFFNSENRNWQIIIPDFGSLTGPFQIVALEYAGQHNGEVTFELAMESAGEILFSTL